MMECLPRYVDGVDIRLASMFLGMSIGMIIFLAGVLIKRVADRTQAPRQ